MYGSFGGGGTMHYGNLERVSKLKCPKRLSGRHVCGTFRAGQSSKRRYARDNLHIPLLPRLPRIVATNA
ncbi:unnamed protein product [Zymoseptoria tritici ST99CH_3D7]|uniref:Uncharacterized protein n=1 Tax=Zymoseptoria tritici (strain ST99CH_3D7) TaxID=1276538 RepID=A0A1X7RVU4_ZYMT9|nr:unnamed protein product [Zymoseptoria tritici ST99CH_3D7]